MTADTPDPITPERGDTRGHLKDRKFLNQEEYHAKHHAKGGPGMRPVESHLDCAECLRQFGVCKRKHRFADFETARLYADEWGMNSGGERLLTPYRCRVCLHYHVATAKGRKRKRAKYRYTRALRRMGANDA